MQSLEDKAFIVLFIHALLRTEALHGSNNFVPLVIFLLTSQHRTINLRGNTAYYNIERISRL